MSDPVTNYINSTEALVDFAVERLSVSPHWSVCKLASMNQNSISDFADALKLPSVSVTHEGSTFSNFPRRTCVISVVVCVDATAKNAEFTARDLSDEVISLLDSEITNGAHYRIRSYQALFSDPGIAMHKLEFCVEDN